jgi:hypothetical protein
MSLINTFAHILSASTSAVENETPAAATVETAERKPLSLAPIMSDDEKAAAAAEANGETAKPAKPKKEKKVMAVKADKPAKGPNKTEQLLAMLKKAKGATGAEVAEAFGWLPHTTRAAISTLLAKPQWPAGHVLDRQKDDKRGLVYRVKLADAAAPEAAGETADAVTTE